MIFIHLAPGLLACMSESTFNTNNVTDALCLGTSEFVSKQASSFSSYVFILGSLKAVYFLVNATDSMRAGHTFLG